LILEECKLCEHNQRGRLSCRYYAYRGKISPNRCKEMSVDPDDIGKYAYGSIDF